MASETIRTDAQRRADPDAAAHPLLPLACLLGLVLFLAIGLLVGVRTLFISEVTDTHERHFVFRRLEEPLYLGARWPLWRGLSTLALLGVLALVATRFVPHLRAALHEGRRARGVWGVFLALAGCIVYLILALWLLLQPGGSGFLWLHVLVPVLAAGLLYAAWMYVRDSVAVAPLWALFLALLRTTVYFVLAFVFLLPAWQNWEKTETHSRVVGLLDVSASMTSRDDLPTESLPPEKLPTRQDKVIRFLTDEQAVFVPRIEEKNPLVLYRFGGVLDESAQVLEGNRNLASGEWATWLKPDPREPIPDSLSEEEKARRRKVQEQLQQLVGGTSLADVLLAVVNREANNMLQGIIVFSDGRSTQYSAQAFDEVRARARKAKVPIFTVAVGEHRQPIHLRITDLQAPEQARPDDKFPVRVEVDGEGLPDQETTVFLDVTNPRGEKKTLQKTIRFSPGTGGPPHAQAEFEIDPAELGTGDRTPELEEGEWSFQARVPRDRREVFLAPEHVSENKPAVQVVKKPLRVLLFGGAASRDFQFIRTLLVREVDKRRAELSVSLQLQREGVVQDVPAERLLKQFPTMLQSEDVPLKAEEKYYNLGQYDLIIAIDPDWSQLQPEQLALLEKWVGTHAGGLVVVGGPVNTYQLARPGNRDKLKPVLDLYPVLLQDSRLQGLGLDRPTTEPWRLHFPGATADMEFLKLDDEAKEPLAGWEEFFTSQPKGEAGKEAPVQRGFFSYYPLDGVKPGATVVATFSDPRARLTNGQEQPYLVTMPYGNGKVVYLGSGETWRLRTYREVFHERFWTKLGRYAGSGNLTRLSRRGVLVMGREFTAGQFVRLEAQLFGRDLQPLSTTALPKVHLKAPPGVTLPPQVEMQPKPTQGGPWAGWFQARFRVNAPGEYRLELQIPETGDILQGRFTVKEANPELDNTRPDFAQLYQLASEATDVLPRVRDKQAQQELLNALEGTAARLLQAVTDETTKAPRPGKAAPDSPGKDREAPRLFFDLGTAHLIPAYLIADSKVQKSRGPFEDLWDRGFSLSERGLLGSDTPVWVSYLLLLVVGLLSVEWLTRKLLKLA